MKKLLALLFLTSSVWANRIPQLMYETAVSSVTTNVVSVSTASAGTGLGATQVDNPQLVGRVALEVQNIDSSANLWCVPVSTQPTVNGGRKIAAGGSWILSIVDNTVIPGGTPGTGTPAKIWCLSDGAAATKAAVTQLY